MLQPTGLLSPLSLWGAEPSLLFPLAFPGNLLGRPVGLRGWLLAKEGSGSILGPFPVLAPGWIREMVFHTVADVGQALRIHQTVSRAFCSHGLMGFYRWGN